MFENIVRFQAAFRPDGTAIVFGAQTITFKSLDEDVDRICSTLSAELSAGTVVAVRVKGLGLHWAILLALSRLGCISASLPTLGERPVNDLLDLISPEVLITDDGTEAHAGKLIVADQAWTERLRTVAARRFPQHRFEPGDTVRIMLSSGTTGSPKKMALSAAALDARINSGATYYGEKTKVFVGVGLDTETGFRSPLVAWSFGAALIQPRQGPVAPTDLSSIAPGVMVAVPAQLQMLLAQLPADASPIPGLTLVVISGAVSSSLMHAVRSRLTPNLFVTYGSTEAGLISMSNAAGYPDRRLGSAGIILPAVEVQVVSDGDSPVEHGATGIVRVKTPEMVQGYMTPAAGEDAWKDGWFYPGDMGHVAETGELFISGRMNDVLDLGGIRISPSEIDHFVGQIPGIIEAASCSRQPPGQYSDILVALICEGDDEPLRSKVSEALATQFPQVRFDVRRVSHLPRNHRGKIDREALRVELVSSGARGSRGALA